MMEDPSATTPLKPPMTPAPMDHGDVALQEAAESQPPRPTTPCSRGRGDGFDPPLRPDSSQREPPQPQKQSEDAGAPFEDCYPPRREDEVRFLRRERERRYQRELLRQMEEKRTQRLQRRREDIRADILQNGRAERLEEYRQRLQSEQRQILRTQLQAQLQRESQREEQREELVEQTRQAQRQQLRDHRQEVDRLGDQLQHQHLHEEAEERPPPSASRGLGEARPEQRITTTVPGTPASRPDADLIRSAPSEKPDLPAGGDITTGVLDNVQLDDRRPWNHFRLLQRELARRRREKAALEAAREAAAARNAERAAREEMEATYKQFLGLRRRGRGRLFRRAEDKAVPARYQPAVRWVERQRQLRVDRDSQLSEWRKTKDKEAQERRAAEVAAKQSVAEASLERQRRADSSFTRWLATIHDRKLQEQAGPVGATGVTTYDEFFSAPWNKVQRPRRRNSVA